MEVAHFACATLANLGEIATLQLRLAENGAIVRVIAVMRSPHLEVQREAGRVLANLAANRENQDVIMKGEIGIFIS